VKDDITRTCNKCGDTRNTVQNLIWKTSNCPYTTTIVSHACRDWTNVLVFPLLNGTARTVLWVGPIKW